MRWIPAALAMAALAVTAACQPLPGAAPPAPTCGAEGYASLVGSNAAAVTFPMGTDVRIIGPQTMVTMDYKADRLNLRVNSVGIITSVDCG